MADENKTQTYVWPVELRENKITERTDDYTASVKTFSDTKSLEYIAKEIVRERTEYRLDTILSIMKLVEEKIRHILYSGYPVMTENVRFAPTITGSFDSHGEVLDDKSMKCGVNVTAGTGRREDRPRERPHHRQDRRNRYAGRHGGSYRFEDQMPQRGWQRYRSLPLV